MSIDFDYRWATADAVTYGDASLLSSTTFLDAEIDHSQFAKPNSTGGSNYVNS